MAKKKILISEDEGIIADDIRRTLEDLGYQVTSIVSSGEDAIKKATEDTPDLVLMDIILDGEIDGIDAAKQIHTNLNIPVVFLTAYADIKTLERAKVTEPFGYIIKPFENRELYTTIEMALHRHALETRLKESEEWLSTTLNSIGDAVITTDTESNITFMNPIAESLTAWNKEDARGKPLKEVFKIINEKTLKPAEDPVANVLCKGTIVGLANHTILIAQDGTETPIDDSAAPIKDDRGNVIGVVLVFRNITERKKADEELKESEKRYRTLFATTPLGIALTTSDGRVIDSNDAMLQLMRYRRTELDQINIGDLYNNPEDRTQLLEHVQKDGFVRDFEAEFRRRDGTTFIASLTVTPLILHGERTLLTMALDITERKKAEKILQQSHNELERLVKERTEDLIESESHFRSLIETAGSVILAMTPDHKIIELNLEAENLYGKKREEVLGKDYFELFLPEEAREAAALDIAKVLAGEPTKNFENPVKAADGSERILLWNVSRLTDAKDQPTGIIAIGQDITERKQIEEALQKAHDELEMRVHERTEELTTTNEQLQQEIKEHRQTEEELLLLQKINNMLNAGISQDKVFKTIVDGLRSLYNYESVAIHLFNKDPKHLTIKSYSADSKVAEKLEKLAHLTVKGYKVPLYPGSLLNEVIETKKPVITTDITWVLKSYSGKKIPEHLIKAGAQLTKAKWGMGVPLMAGDKILGAIGCGSTEKLTEEDAQRFALIGAQAGLAIEKALTYERLEKAYDNLKKSDKLKDLFIDIMSHDLLNPAGAARNMAKLALEEEGDPEKRDILHRIHNGNDRIIDMIENATILARLESGENLEFKEIDLGDALQSTAQELKPLADKKKIKMTQAKKGKFKARANPLIYSVFSNLISNAIKYSPDNSEIVLGIMKSDNQWKISVADNGEGIPDEHKEIIFNRFERVKKGDIKGTGLGLAIVKKVMKAHGGRAWAEDNPKGGSIFYVSLPVV